MSLQQWQDLQTIYSAEKDRARARILSLLLSMSVGASLIGIFPALLTKEWMTVAAILTGCAGFILSFVLLRSGRLRASSFVFVGFALGTATFVATVGQGIRDVALLLFPIVFIYAGVTLNRRYFAVTVVLGLVAACWLGMGEVYGWLIPRPYDGALQTWSLLIFVIIMLVIAAAATNLLVMNMRKNLELALKENADRKKVVEELNQSYKLLANLTRLVPGVVYQYRVYPDGRSAFPYSSPGMNDIYECTPEEVREDATPVFGRLHPDDYERVGNGIQESARTLQEFYCEFRVVLPRQGLRWRWSQAHPERMEDGGTLWHGIISDITERKKAEETLQLSSKELKTKNDELERFLYTASHDLRTPVVTIQSFMRCLEQDMAASDSARVEKAVKYIKSAADTMVRMLDEALEMSRVGRVIGASSYVTARAVVDDGMNAVTGVITDRGVIVKVADMDVSLYGDRPRLAEIWQNVIENACKFMGEQKAPHIDIGMEQRGKETVFFVRDNGIGIDPQYHDRVFNLFERLDKKGEGTGMGLAIVKRIVELYQGRIWVESAGAGQGTSFCFTLPGAIKTEGKT